MVKYIYGKTRNAQILLSATQKQRQDLSKKLSQCRNLSSSSFFIKLGEREVKFNL